MGEGMSILELSSSIVIIGSSSETMSPFFTKILVTINFPTNFILGIVRVFNSSISFLFSMSFLISESESFSLRNSLEPSSEATKLPSETLSPIFI